MLKPKKFLIMNININFIKHVDTYWERRQEWAICYRDSTSTRGINTNNYAEAGIRILKDIVFQRIRAYNLVQFFEFITVTFEMYSISGIQ